MKPDDLLDAVGRVAREHERVDERLERLAAGTLSDQERAELEREAATNPELARALELFRPLDADVRARIAAEVAPVRQLRTARPEPSRLVWLAAALAAAAAVVLVLLFRSGPEPLPDYELAALGGVSEQRAPSTAVQIAPGAELTLLLRPATSVVGDVVAYAFRVDGGEVVPLDVRVQRSETGAVRLELSADPLLAGQGSRRLVRVVVARASAVSSPKQAAALAGRGPGQGAGHQVLETEIGVRP